MRSIVLVALLVTAAAADDKSQQALLEKGRVLEGQGKHAFDDNCFHRDHAWGWDERGTIVIGVGASKRPAAPPALVTSATEWESDDQTKWTELDVNVKLGWNTDGTLDITGKLLHPTMKSFQPIMPDDLDPDNVLGHHLLVFP